MRRLIILIVIAIVVAALFFANRMLGDSHHLIANQPGAVLYAAAFDGFNEDWEQYPGRLSAAIEDARMIIRVNEANTGAFSTASPFFTDFDVRVRTSPLEGALNTAFGLVFRLRDGGNRQRGDDSYYQFLISDDGYYRVVRVISGDETIISDWIESDAIRQGLDEENSVRVVASGANFRFYINDQPVSLCIPDDPVGLSTFYNGVCIQGTLLDTWADTAEFVGYGQLGVVARTIEGGEGGMAAAFDDFVVMGIP